VTVVVRSLALLVLVAPLWGGCWVDREEPPFIVPGTCNHNGMCEVDKNEDCTDCNDDCPCCRGNQVIAEGVQNPEKALGDGDGEFAMLGPDAVLQLEVGSEILDRAGLDFVLVGEVLSESSVGLSDSCPIVAPVGDFYQVEASQGGSEWHFVGFWTKVTTPSTAGQGMAFDLGCASSGVGTSARWVRLSPVGKPSAKLDALNATSCE
jgi:hypothetical protein